MVMNVTLLSDRDARDTGVTDTPFRVRPTFDGTNDFFWTSGADGLLRFLRCQTCAYHLHPPGPMCPACGGRDLEPEPVSGRGAIHTYTVNFKSWDGTADPYVIAIVELAEQVGLRLTTNIVGTDPDDVAIGQPVEVSFEERDGLYWPLFRVVAEDR
jgi:uncharacterized OB-fold protein